MDADETVVGREMGQDWVVFLFPLYVCKSTISQHGLAENECQDYIMSQGT